MKKNRQKGFTLVELSLVLVIIGLIVGGVIVGQELIDVAKIRSVMKEQNSFKTGMHAFQTKFNNNLPGDMRDAWRFWGTDCAVDQDTCNGNGDGLVETRVGVEKNEGVMFWRHMELAGLGDGVYTGECQGPSTSICGTAPNVNVPASSWSDAAAWVPDSFSYSPATRNSFMLYKTHPTNFANYSLFTTYDVWRFDVKYDDGLPTRGGVKWVPASDSSLACYIPAANPPSYDFSLSGLECSLHISFNY